MAGLKTGGRAEGSAKSVCVIGAGLTGLVCACALLEQGFDVTLLESAQEPGGMVASFCLGQSRIEYIYHHVFTTDTYLMDLIDELGLSDRLRWYKNKDALYSANRTFPFSTPFDLIRFPLIPFWQRLRTGLAVLRAGRLKNWLALENETAAEWLTRNGGRQAYERIWQPLLFSKFANDAANVSAVWIWNKFKLRGGSRDKNSGSARLGYLDGSFGLVIDRLIDRIKAKGGRLLTGHTVMNISRSPSLNKRFAVSCILADCTTVNIPAAAVVATVSGRQFTSMTTGFSWPGSYKRLVDGLAYKANLCLVLRLKKSLSPYYWTTVLDDLPFVVAIEHTSLTGSAPYDGHVIYLSRYLDLADPLWLQPDGQVYRHFIDSLALVHPRFNQADVLDWRLRRTRYAQPVISRDYSALKPDINTPEPGLKLAGMAQIYPEDRGMNYAVRLGRQAAAAVAGDLLGEADEKDKA